MYLDANAHVLLLPEVKEFIANYQDLGHPSATHFLGRKAAQEIESARFNIARMLGAQSQNQIFFTSGCTQAAEWGIKILDKIKNKNDQISYSKFEHVAVWDAIETLCCNFNSKIRNASKLVSIHSHNETGIIQNLNDIKTKPEQILFSDLSQSIGKISLSLSTMPVDIAIFGAHKFGGPASVGFLYLKDPAWWVEFGTGGRYILDRPGTPDLIGIRATEIALKIALDTLEKRTENMNNFQNVLEIGLKQRGARIIGENKNRLPNTTFFYYKDYAVDKMLKMSERGIYFGLGSACGSVATGISPSLKALGETGDIFSYARVSQWGEYDAKDAEKFLQIFDEVT